ncbi:hypothetical protein EMPS_02383 [Entomortierella parvispora]|uniref:Ubiquitin-like domain-containing protein n=1 Tax=Entomortierella parvispora TaxID=205924 RepID=A0A9P3H4M3_9FUNG|nr:hypothetical protein EMPS_02383 [Entomortierella parvispora]
MRVVVKDINTSTLTDVHVRLFDKLERVKCELQNRLGIKPCEQRLIFGGLELDEDCTMFECNLKDGSTVELHPCPKNHVQILVKELTGRTLVMNVSLYETVKSLKEKIQAERKDISVTRQTLIFEGKKLDSDEILGEYNIQHKSTVRLRVGIMLTVCMEEGRKILTFAAEPTDQVRELMMEIERHHRIPQGQQRLLFEGRRMAPEESLFDCGIVKDSILDLAIMKRMWISIELPGGNFMHFDTEPEETIREIKHKIHERKDIPCEDQCLQLGSYRLQDDWSVFDSNIQQKSVLRLTLRPAGNFPITVETIAGKSFRLDVNSQDTILSLKRQINDVEDISLDLQRLVFDSRVLEDHHTLAFYRIREDSVVRLRTIIHVVVELSEGRTLTLKGEPTDPVKKLKQMIADAEGIPKEDQTLWLDDEFAE